MRSAMTSVVSVLIPALAPALAVHVSTRIDTACVCVCAFSVYPNLVGVFCLHVIDEIAPRISFSSDEIVCIANKCLQGVFKTIRISRLHAEST